MKMKSEDHQNIIKQMADRLRDHSVPYQEGAWERFKEMEKKRPIYMVLWPYVSAAAVILIAIVLLLNPSQQIIAPRELVVQDIEKQEHKEENNDKMLREKENHVSKKVNAPKDLDGASLIASTSNRELGTKTNLLKQREIIVDTKTTNEIFSDNNLQMENLLKVEEMTVYNHEDIGLSENGKGVKEAVTELPLIASMERKEPVDFLMALSSLKENESYNENYNMDKKWSVGLEVSPNIGNNKHVNMGGGVSFAYSVSPKVSISSGISYLQVGAEGMPGGSLNSPPSFSSAGPPALDISTPGVAYPGGRSQTKILNKIEASVVGLDIPFAINYHVNKRVYASAGFSVFNVLNEGRLSQFENRIVDVVYRGAENNTPEPVVQTFLSKETISEKDFEERNVNGFFNFSVGYSIPISKKVGLSIEPFFKLQMNSLVEEDMNLSNGGIKISTRF